MDVNMVIRGSLESTRWEDNATSTWTMWENSEIIKDSSTWTTLDDEAMVEELWDDNTMIKDLSTWTSLEDNAIINASSTIKGLSSWARWEDKVFEEALVMFPEELCDRLFLVGLERYGKGDWRSISRHVVVTKSATQVASHAQKYFLRQSCRQKSRKRRSSIHDIKLFPPPPPPLPPHPPPPPPPPPQCNASRNYPHNH
ncbi:hypothetical protein NMG60_11029974 [Bertholletia excelsa]